jgi:3-dehydroquinate synthase
MPAGERFKTLRTVGRLYGALYEAGIDRKGLVVTVGGGVVGDVGGFAAATYLRGIRFVQAPTTLLAQVDASIGGKTGVDLAQGKNLVGAFHQPSAVYIDPDTLETLPRRHVRSGLAEIVKHGIICDDRLFALVHESASRLCRRGSMELDAAIVRSCEIKAGVVTADETEQGLRAILNFGHTVGHAIEALTGYRRYFHGEAVAIGMVSAACIGERAGVTPLDVRPALVGALRGLRLPVDLPADLSTEDLLGAMLRDKKALRGRHRLVLAERIGRARVVEDVHPDLIRAGLEQHRLLARD